MDSPKMVATIYSVLLANGSRMVLHQWNDKIWFINWPNGIQIVIAQGHSVARAFICALYFLLRRAHQKASNQTSRHSFFPLANFKWRDKHNKRHSAASRHLNHKRNEIELPFVLRSCQKQTFPLPAQHSNCKYDSTFLVHAIVLSSVQAFHGRNEISAADNRIARNYSNC